MDDVRRYVAKYESHPGKTLISHTNGVCERAMGIWPDYRVRTTALGHDFGKLNPNFRLKLKGLPCDGLYTNHAYLSYLILWCYRQANGWRKGIIESPADFVLTSACALKHHGGLRNFFNSTNGSLLINSEEVDRLYEFLKGSPNIPAEELMRQLNFDKDLKSFDVKTVPKQHLLNLFRSAKNLNRYIPTEHEKLLFSLDLRMCFSSLVCGDKGDAGNQAMEEIEKRNKKFMKGYASKVHSYTKTLKPTTDLNVLRTEMREVALANLRWILDSIHDQRTFSLTYPTGAGKTVTLLELSTEIIRRVGERRVIYSIPFLSITEQIFDIIENKVFSNDDKYCIKRIDCKASPVEKYDIEDDTQNRNLVKRVSTFLRKVLKGKTIREEAIDQLLRQDYMEASFNYSFLVTTFVQFFQGFTTASNRGLMRYSHLKGAIFLIDELQALSPGLYTFFVALIDAFCRRFDSYAIFSTATMPYFELPSRSIEARKMFKDYVPPVEIGDKNFYTHPIFNRYEIRALDIPYNALSLSLAVSKHDVPTLVVLNTVQDSRDVYCALKGMVDCKVYLINSNFHAKSRRIILRRVKEHISKKERVFLVSTQLIEAGVDIDFDIVYRDIAPLPNIIQTAGRCNREGRPIHGIVYVFQYVDDKLRLRADTIYNGFPDGPFLKYAIDVFFNSGKSIYEEKDLLPVQEGFFKFVADNLQFGGWDDKKNFLDQINKFQYGDIGDYTIIPKKRYGIQEQFYVPKSDKDQTYEKLHEYIAHKAMLEDSAPGDHKDKIREILLVTKQLHEHVRYMMDRVVQVNLPKDADPKVYASDEFDDQVCHIYKLKPGLYSHELGFKV